MQVAYSLRQYTNNLRTIVRQANLNCKTVIFCKIAMSICLFVGKIAAKCAEIDFFCKKIHFLAYPMQSFGVFARHGNSWCKANFR